MAAEYDDSGGLNTSPDIVMQDAPSHKDNALYTAGTIYHILYNASTDGQDISALESKYVSNDHDPDDLIEIQPEDVPIVEQWATKYDTAIRLDDAPWVNSYRSSFERKTREISLLQYAMIGSSIRPGQMRLRRLKAKRLSKHTAQSPWAISDMYKNDHFGTPDGNTDKDMPASNTEESDESNTPAAVKDIDHLETAPGSEIQGSGRGSYICSAVQLLSKPLERLFVHGLYRGHLKSKNTFSACTSSFEDADGLRLVEFPVAVHQLLRKRTENKSDPVSPSDFFQAVEDLSHGKFTPAGGSVNSFVDWLVMALVEGLGNRPGRLALQPVHERSVQFLRQHSASPILDIFVSLYHRTRRCNICHEETDSYNHIFSTTISPVDHDHAPFDIQHQFESSMVEDRICTCNTNETHTTEEIHMLSAPKYLLLHVSYQTFDHNPVPTYPVFDLKIAQSSTTSIYYDLQALISTEDTMLDELNHVTWILHEAMWFKYNNTGYCSVEPSFLENLPPRPLLLLYRRK